MFLKPKPCRLLRHFSSFFSLIRFDDLTRAGFIVLNLAVQFEVLDLSASFFFSRDFFSLQYQRYETRQKQEAVTLGSVEIFR
jgi:hypothetical protein